MTSTFMMIEILTLANELRGVTGGLLTSKLS
jgi:hypothetical protein